MAKKEKEASKKGKDKSEKKEKAAVKADKPGTAKYTYPKDCVTDADKKKYRSVMRAGKEWEGPGKAGGGKTSKKEKKDPGTPKAVIMDGKGKKIREEENTGAKSEGKKKKKKADKED